MTVVRLVCRLRGWEVVLHVSPVFGNARGLAGRMRREGLDARDEDGTVVVEVSG